MMKHTDAITFWDRNGNEILTVIGNDSSELLDVFDTPTIRDAIRDRIGLVVDNISEEFADDYLDGACP